MIIAICGSTRFLQWINAWHRALTLSGHIVLDKGMPPLENTKQWMAPEHKEIVAKVMREKIELADALLCINVFAYMGDDTLALRDFARRLGKSIYTLESWGKGHGVGSAHHVNWQMAKRDIFSIPPSYMSPIDTASNWRSPFDLLGPGGPFRDRLVEMVKAPEEDILRGSAL